MSSVQGILKRFEKDDSESSPPPPTTTDSNFERNEELRRSIKEKASHTRTRKSSRERTFVGSPKRFAPKPPTIVKFTPPVHWRENFSNHSVPPKPSHLTSKGDTTEEGNSKERASRATTVSSYDSDDDLPIGGESDFDDFDDDDDDSLCDQDQDHHELEASEEEVEEVVRFISDAHKVAHELLTSERNYVKKLYLLDQVFYFTIDQENRAFDMFPIEVTSKIFPNIKPIYQFHHEHFLPELEERLSDWPSKPFIGDLMTRFSPFFRMYSEYVKNFDNALKLLDEWQQRSPKFTSLIETLQKDKRSCSLTLQHHMLEPVQRIPRYQLLLQDYLKKLGPDSDDEESTKSALALIKDAAQNSNDVMKKLESFQKLLEINSQLDGFEVIKPNRELVKEGKMVKLSARRGEPQERYLFLFNDLLLCCNLPLKIGNRKPNYKVHSHMDIYGMEIMESDLFTNAFRVRSKQKSVEFQGSSEEESQDWKKLIEKAIKICENKKRTFQRRWSIPTSETNNSHEPKAKEEFVLGERAPTWVRDGDANMCMRCGTEFSITKRKHHCRACGHIVCHRCSDNTIPLKWENSRPSRVCIKCYYIFKVPKMVKEKDEDFSCFVYIPENSIIPNIFRRKMTWSKCWIIIRGSSLHLYESSMLDYKPKLSLPLADYGPEETVEEDHIDRPHSFKLQYQSRVHYFSVDSSQLKDQLYQKLSDVYSQSSTVRCTTDGTI